MTVSHNRLSRVGGTEWSDVSHAMRRVCSAWAARTDLTVFVGPDGGQGKALAFFSPRDREIEINSDAAFPGVSPTTIGDLTSRMELSRFPVAGGLAMHESGHARYSPDPSPEIRAQFSPEAEYRVYTYLDETRAEGRMVARWPADRGYLRASARTLWDQDHGKMPSARFAAQLIVGRAEVRSLLEEDVAKVEAWLAAQPGWSWAILQQVRNIVGDHMLLEKFDVPEMVKLAKRLHKIMPLDPEEDGGEELGDLIAGALGRALREGMVEVIDSATEQAADEEQARKEAESHEQNQNKQKAMETFRSGAASYVPSELSSSRAPTSKEHAASVTLSRELEKARYRDREKVEYDSEIPPGRFNSGEAMRLDAARTMNAPTERYRPFTRIDRVETEEPKLTVGMMSDVSGSMLYLQPAVGSAVWVIADAVYRLKDATAAAVYFGDKTYAGLRAGDRPSRVRTWSGGGGYEDFDGGFRALDGELQLLNGSGARVLVVVSDGQYKDRSYRNPINQNAARDKWIKACTSKGVAVLWLALGGSAEVELVNGLEVVAASEDEIKTAELIGKACVKALKAVSRR